MTNKKFIEELNREELELVFKENQKLQHEVLDDMMDTEIFYIGEAMDEIRDYLADYSVGTSAPSYLRFSDFGGAASMQGLVSGLRSMQDSFGTFSDEDEAGVLKPLEALLEAYLDTSFDSEEYDSLDEAVEESIRLTLDHLSELFDKQLRANYNSENQLDYFLSFYVDAQMDEEETFYILPDEGNYKLYKDISYTESF